MNIYDEQDDQYTDADDSAEIGVTGDSAEGSQEGSAASPAQEDLPWDYGEIMGGVDSEVKPTTTATAEPEYDPYDKDQMLQIMRDEAAKVATSLSVSQFLAIQQEMDELSRVTAGWQEGARSVARKAFEDTVRANPAAASQPGLAKMVAGFVMMSAAEKGRDVRQKQVKGPPAAPVAANTRNADPKTDAQVDALYATIKRHNPKVTKEQIRKQLEAEQP